MCLGPALSMSISKTDAITGKFNPLTAGKRLIVNDEIGVPKHSFHTHNDTMKALITETDTVLEKKGVDARIVQDHSIYVFISNHRAPLRVDPGDRRYLVLQCSEHARNDEAYFDSLRKSLAHPDAAPSFLRYMLDKDIAGFNFHKVPSTARKAAEMEAENLSSVEQWLLELIDSSDGLAWSAPCDSTYERYADWCKTSAVKPKARNRFGSLLKEHGINKKKIRIGDRAEHRFAHFYEFPGCGPDAAGDHNDEELNEVPAF